MLYTYAIWLEVKLQWGKLFDVVEGHSKELNYCRDIIHGTKADSRS